MDTESTAPPPGPEPPPPATTMTPRPTLQLSDMGTPRPRRFCRPTFELPGTIMVPPKTPDNNVIEKKLKEIMKQSGILCINGVKYQSEMKELEELGQLGFGTSGHVFKMLHIPSQEIVAVKQMRRSGNPEENKRIAMDLEVVLKSHDCPYIVQCLGCFITQAEVWICMELMSTCFDKLLKRLESPIPEPIVGKVTLATVRALHYLKETHGVIHRDVKPSNILLDDRGNVKLCDFGISGHLVNSKADSKNAGCTAYLAPERINPPDPTKPAYDIRADVWALGITLVELATGVFPYPGCTSDFEVLSRVLADDPPSLPPEGFSPQFRDFLQSCLAKDYTKRPKYKELLEHSFLKKYVKENVDVASWYASSLPVDPQNHRNKNGLESSAGHHRSQSDASSTKVPSSSFKLNSPLLTKQLSNGMNSGPPSPLLFQRFLHQQAQAESRRRSTSVSPSRQLRNFNNGCSSKYVVTEDGSDDHEPGSVSTNVGCGRMKIASYLRSRLGSCGGGSIDVPEPPPRSNRGASPLGNHRGPTSPPLGTSPSLPRRYVSPSPPQPPPRRLSESVSVPGSPHHTRLAVFTPQPLRRLFQHRPAQAQTGSSTQQ